MTSRTSPATPSPALAMAAALTPRLIIIGALIAAALVNDARAVLIGAAAPLAAFYLVRRALLRRSRRAGHSEQIHPTTPPGSGPAAAHGASEPTPRRDIPRATERGAR
jgi:hypothetical protein